MNAAQHKFVNMLVQSASESRASLHDVAGGMLCLLMIAAIIGLGLVWLWILRGGLSTYLSLDSTATRRAFEDWLREP